MIIIVRFSVSQSIIRYASGLGLSDLQSAKRQAGRQAGRAVREFLWLVISYRIAAAAKCNSEAHPGLLPTQSASKQAFLVITAAACLLACPFACFAAYVPLIVYSSRLD